MTAAIGLMIGSGLYFAAAVALVIALIALSLFRWFEAKVPSLQYARVEVRQRPDAEVSEDELTRVFASHAISSVGTSYHLDDDVLSYEFTVRTRDGSNFGRLAEALRGMDQVSFSIIRTSD
jgi:putative Mg2+ transporter-C (MgtC) family protein